MAPSDIVWRDDKEIKLALVGDAGVGKTTWVSRLIDGEPPTSVPTTVTPAIGYECRSCRFSTNIGSVLFNIWDISGSHTTVQERAQWIHDSDAAIIMVDLADRTSIENAVYWYREIVASRKHSDKSASLPVTIYARKVYENLGDKGGIDLTGISWSRELRDTPFFYNPHKWLAGPEANEIRADEIETRPFQWIIEQLSGHPNVVYPPDLSGLSSFDSDPELLKYKAEMDEACKGILLSDDDDL